MLQKFNKATSIRIRSKQSDHSELLDEELKTAGMDTNFIIPAVWKTACLLVEGIQISCNYYWVTYFE